MALRNWAYIFLSPGFAAGKNMIVTESDTCRFTAVGIDPNDKAQVVEVAKQLVADGAQMIELCGGFGPVWITKLNEALGESVPVGGVAYGPEWRQPMLDILK